MPMQDYEQFIKRINALKNQPMPNELLACIDQKSLDAIIHLISNNMSKQKRFKGLSANQALRISKTYSGFARTFCVLRDSNGRYQCILETKSKNAKNKKQMTQKAEGGFKIGKPAWRLDAQDGPKPYLSLVLFLKENGSLSDLNDKIIIKKIAALKAEVSLPWEFDKEVNLQRNTLGEIYVNKKNALVASIYSKMGMPLDEAIKDGSLNNQEREQIAESLLKTVIALHRQKVVYQDLKPANILLFRNKSGKLKVKLTDPGHVSKPGHEETSVATAGYESPEIAMAHSVEETYYYSYYKGGYKKKGNSLGKKGAVHLEKQLRNKGELEKIKQLKKKGLKADSANDMWAMGITLYELFRNKKPTTLPTGKRFAGFFTLRESRLTAEEALKDWKKSRPHC